MQSPFSGMDPFIEGCGLWEDFHHDLITAIKADLAARVPAHYVVRTGERAYVALIDPEQGRQEHVFKPDVGVIQPNQRADAGGTAGTATLAGSQVDTSMDVEAVTLRALVPEEFREAFVEIHTTEPERRLITVIEVLSPSNKRKDTPGWEQYLRKRHGLLAGDANLVEIDLLRGGQRLPMVDPWPDWPYYLMVARKAKVPYCLVIKAHYRAPLPAVPVPLQAPDADLPLDLQPMISAIYARSRYDQDIDYTKRLSPPLSPEDLEWLRAARE
jgi:hypothetical protein